jgi:radical SAM superfamily enzyme YgiQ (UPF0313 family)
MQKKIKKVLLIGSYNPERIRTGQYLSPPLGIYRIASHLEKKTSVNVDVVDPTLDYIETINKIKSKKYNIIGHSILHPNLKEDLELIWKTHELSPSSIQIAGGQGATFNAKEILTKTPVKAVSRGFGEQIVEQIVENNGKFNNIKGMYVSQDKEIIPTGNVKKMDLMEFKDLSFNLGFDKIPYPRYWKFMEKQYDKEHVHAMRNEGMLKTIRLMVSNYCPLGCTHYTSTNFLNEAIEGNQRVLFLEPQEIISIMNKATKAHPDTEAFYFNDDNFLLLRKNKILEFCELTRGLNKKYNLMFQGRIDDVDKETLIEMGKAGFKIGFYGAETFSDRLARDIRKIKTGNQDYGELVKKVLQDTMDAGLVAQFSLMLFLPSSKQEDLETTIESTLDLMEEGARATIFPYVEAYSGAKIVDNHEVSYREFDIENQHFKIPYLVLPDDKNVRSLAEDSIKLKEKLNKKSIWTKYNGKVPQPVDSLNLFSAIYKLSGKSTKRIENMLKEY